MTYDVLIKCDKRDKRQHRRHMRKYRMYWNGDGFIGRVSEWKYEDLASYCRKNHLKYSIDNGFGVRSNDYRREFFSHYPPMIHNMYFCAYCGRLISKQKITVDHLYPVSVANRSISVQKKLRRCGINNINNYKNLVPACKRCNRRKSANMGIWLLRGQLGRFQHLWLIRHAIRITTFILITTFAYNHGYIDTLINTIRSFV